MIKEIENAVAKYIVIAENVLGMNFGMPKIQYSLRGTTAGSAERHTHELNFNRAIFEENRDLFLRRTVPHEVAHRVSIMYFGVEAGKGHGTKWKFIMRNIFNVPEELISRCHSYDVAHLKTRNIRKWKYSCGCQTFELTTIKHNKIHAGRSKYRCKCCHNRLVFTGEQA